MIACAAARRALLAVEDRGRATIREPECSRDGQSIRHRLVVLLYTAPPADEHVVDAIEFG
jgi:hypothetical protein